MDKNLTLAAERHASFSRRHFFRNVGACIALPAFASLYSRGAFAKTANKIAPTRMAFVYVPNGAIPSAFWPAAPGDDFALSPTLSPLANVHKQLQVIGSWASEPRHMKMAIEFLRSTQKQFPFAEMVSHRFPLEKANEALATSAAWQSAKSVIVPSLQVA